jgi:hypothetical protein
MRFPEVLWLEADVRTLRRGRRDTSLVSEIAHDGRTNGIDSRYCGRIEPALRQYGSIAGGPVGDAAKALAPARASWEAVAVIASEQLASQGLMLHDVDHRGIIVDIRGIQQNA